MRKSLVYLAGPISGLTYDDSIDWRAEVALLAPEHLELISPMRGKSYLKNIANGGVIADSYATIPLSSKRGVMTRDYNDVVRADALLVNLLGTTRVSIGTVMEISWAYMLRKPVVVVMEAEGNPHAHCMLDEATSLRAADLEEGLHLISVILGTGV